MRADPPHLGLVDLAETPPPTPPPDGIMEAEVDEVVGEEGMGGDTAPTETRLTPIIAPLTTPIMVKGIRIGERVTGGMDGAGPRTVPEIMTGAVDIGLPRRVEEDPTRIVAPVGIVRSERMPTRALDMVLMPRLLKLASLILMCRRRVPTLVDRPPPMFLTQPPPTHPMLGRRMVSGKRIGMGDTDTGRVF